MAENESIFRRANEKLEERFRELEAEGLTPLLCECGDATCTQVIRLTLDEYEGVRGHAAHFAIVSGHQILVAERVVEQNERYDVVEKTDDGRQWPKPATRAEPFPSLGLRLILRVVPTSERVGKNEALFREVNERIRDVSGQLVVFDGDAPLQFVCECSDEGCHESVVLTLPEYEAVRADGTHFIVAPGHVWEPDDEHVVGEAERYTVVEKAGDAGDVAEEEDPR